MSDLGLLASRTPADANAFVVATFTCASTGSGLDLEQFVAYHRRATAPRLSDLLSAQHPQQLAALRAAFAKWAAFGHRGAGTPKDLGSAHWLKVLRDTKLVTPAKLSSTDADLIFSKCKAKGAQRLTFAQFVDGLGMVAARLGRDVIQVVRQINACQGPVLNGTQIDPRRYINDDSQPAAPQRKASHRSSAGGHSAGTPPHPCLSAPDSYEDSAGFTIPAGRCSSPHTPASHPAAVAEEEAQAADDVANLCRAFTAFAAFGKGHGPGGGGATVLKVIFYSFFRLLLPGRLGRLPGLACMPMAFDGPLHCYGMQPHTVAFKLMVTPAALPPLLQAEMDSLQFAKLCRDSGLVGGATAGPGPEVDLAFTKARARGARRLGFGEFLTALALLAQEQGASEDDVLAAVAACPGPRRM